MRDTLVAALYGSALVGMTVAGMAWHRDDPQTLEDCNEALKVALPIRLSYSGRVTDHKPEELCYCKPKLVDTGIKFYRPQEDPQ